VLKDKAMNSCYELGIEVVSQLTKRRIEIMQAIADNPQLTLAHVAGLLGIAESTLRNNLSFYSCSLRKFTLVIVWKAIGFLTKTLCLVINKLKMGKYFADCGFS
jgi:hypothetical protein